MREARSPLPSSRSPALEWGPVGIGMRGAVGAVERACIVCEGAGSALEGRGGGATAAIGTCCGWYP